MAVRFDLTDANALFAGTSPVLTCTATAATGIAGWHIQFTLRRRPGSAALVTKTLGAGVAITDSVNGVFTVTLSAASDWANVPPGKYWYSIMRTDSGAEDELAYGEVLVKPSS